MLDSTDFSTQKKIFAESFKNLFLLPRFFGLSSQLFSGFESHKTYPKLWNELAILLDKSCVTLLQINKYKKKLGKNVFKILIR